GFHREFSPVPAGREPRQGQDQSLRRGPEGRLECFLLRLRPVLKPLPARKREPPLRLGKEPPSLRALLPEPARPREPEYSAAARGSGSRNCQGPSPRPSGQNRGPSGPWRNPLATDDKPPRRKREPRP